MTALFPSACVAALLALVAGPAWGQLAPAKAPQPAPPAAAADDEWVRSQQDDAGAVQSLQTAIGRYEDPSRGLTIDLVGAIHVGDRAYYEALNDRFRGYDAVLYELVAPEGTVVPRGGRVASDNALGAMQNGMKGMLALEHQLEIVDYTRPNFVHADMSPNTLLATMDKRDESVVKLYLRMLGQSIAEQTKAAQKGESAEMDMMRALLAPAEERPRRLKLTMAGQLTQLEGLLTSFGGEKGTTLIQERNRTALDVLERELAAGKRHVAVFYGAGHLTDMHARLVERFGVRQVGKEWLTAWDLREPAAR